MFLSQLIPAHPPSLKFCVISNKNARGIHHTIMCLNTYVRHCDPQKRKHYSVIFCVPIINRA